MIINKVINRLNDRLTAITGSYPLWTGFLLTFSLVALVCTLSFASGDSTSVIYKIDVKEEIGPGIARKMSRGISEAEQMKADLIIVHMNTYGGLVDAADSMRTRLLNLNIPVVAFIDNNAASAGALISIACNRIYMRSGASIGAATVVDMNATEMPDKYQSYMRSMMRATAEKRGRDPLIAEAMVDQRTYIPGVIDSGKVLTFTTSEAIKNGYCEGQKETIEEVIAAEGFTDYELKQYQVTFMDKIISFLINPAVSGVLVLLILGGIYFELQTPGVGFPLAAACIAAILYFAPLYLEGLAANWEILLAVVGFILLAIEVLVLPGFGVAGISGIVCLFAAFVFSMLNNDGFNFEPVPADAIARAASVVLLAFLGSIVFAIAFGSRFMKSKRFASLVLSDSMTAEQGYTSSNAHLKDLVGTRATTLSYLRPSGKILVDDTTYSANAELGFIESGKNVVITRFDGMIFWVKEINES